MNSTRRPNRLTDSILSIDKPPGIDCKEAIALDVACLPLLYFVAITLTPRLYYYLIKVAILARACRTIW